MLHTTLRLAHEAGACTNSYRAVAKALGGIQAWGLDTPIPLVHILDIRGLDDTLWCLCCIIPEDEAARDKLARLLACDYAEHVAGFWVAPAGVSWQPRDTIEVARRYAYGDATLLELEAVRKVANAARSAAWSSSAEDCARRASWNSASTSAWSAQDSARNIARMVSVSAAKSAFLNNAWSAEREWQAQRLREVLEA
ncbi:MAG TPA: hypothetical protein VJM51_01565 [Dehalococcoidia bacterium]|nr:hypothetical protein [Dehalococcoidia bacterium]